MTKPLPPVEEFAKAEWTTADGRRIRIGQLENNHLANIIDWIIKNRSAYEPHADWLLAGFHREAEARGLTIRFLEQAPYPYELRL